MPRECRNFNNIGKVSCLLLLLLTFLAINPIANSSAFAEDVEGNYFETGFNSSDDFNETDDMDDFASLADTPSTVNISFSPASGTASISPTTSTGQSAQINVLATVSVQNSGGYSVYLKGNSTNLIGQSNSSNVIPGATTAKTYTNMDTNTWGYNATVGTAVPDNATYKAVSVSSNGEKIAENTTKKIYTDTKNIMLSFAAKVSDTKPADTYKNTITMSVISSPLQVTFAESGITTMQAMTSSICSNAPVGDSIQLKDTRDNKYYWIGKLVDGKCWMTQNLDLDLSTSTALVPATSDVTSNYTPAYNTATIASVDTILNEATGQRSWSLGNYRITNPANDNSCGMGATNIEACKGTDNSRFTPYNTPTSASKDINAHYIVGNHYQWNAATAGTGGTITGGQASSSICPKGWRLPTGNTSGEFQTLVNAGSIGSSITKLSSSPYYFVRGGVVSQDASYLLYVAGANGNYWSSTSYSSAANAYGLSFSSTSTIFPSNNGARLGGRSLRCLAR